MFHLSSKFFKQAVRRTRLRCCAEQFFFGEPMFWSLRWVHCFSLVYKLFAIRIFPKECENTGRCCLDLQKRFQSKDLLCCLVGLQEIHFQIRRRDPDARIHLTWDKLFINTQVFCYLSTLWCWSQTSSSYHLRSAIHSGCTIAHCGKFKHNFGENISNFWHIWRALSGLCLFRGERWSGTPRERGEQCDSSSKPLNI